jgi:DUF1365 family protein
VTPALPAIYEGVTTHHRHAPRQHRLRYGIFMMLFDLDRLDQMDRDLKRFSHNRFNWLSFHDKDHAGGADLRGWADQHMRNAGLEPDGGPIQLLCMPRLAGFVFNPLSVWFLWRHTGELAAMLYEVRNTFGEQHSYLIPAAPEDAKVVDQDCEKGFFVSPFMDMDLHYHFRVLPPAEQVVVDIAVSQHGQPLLDARFAGQRVELTDAAIGRSLWRHPAMTLGVVFGIHWEALKIVLKGIGLRPRPAKPKAEVSYIRG